MPDEKPTILCVDDEAIPLTLRKSVLEKSGFHVIAADTGKRALEILEHERVDLVLTDFLMPGFRSAPAHNRLMLNLLRAQIANVLHLA